MFGLKQPKVQYIDLLQEFRGPMILDFHILDRVWVTETMRNARYRCPGHPSHDPNLKVGDEEPIDGVIIGETYERIYLEMLRTDTWPPDWEKFKVSDTWFHDNDTKLTMRADGYSVLLKNGTIIDAYSVKKNHGEMQEVFDYMDEIEARKKFLIESQERYEAELNSFAAHLEKGKALKKKFFDQI